MESDRWHRTSGVESDQWNQFHEIDSMESSPWNRASGIGEMESGQWNRIHDAESIESHTKCQRLDNFLWKFLIPIKENITHVTFMRFFDHFCTGFCDRGGLAPFARSNVVGVSAHPFQRDENPSRLETPVREQCRAPSILEKTRFEFFSIKQNSVRASFS